MVTKVSSHGSGYTCILTTRGCRDTYRPSMRTDLPHKTGCLAKQAQRFKLWGSEIAENTPEVNYESVMESDAGVAEWTRKIVRIYFLPL